MTGTETPVQAWPGGGSGSLLLFLFSALLVIALAFVTVRWLARWQFHIARGRRMRVLEGLAVGRDRYLLLVQVGQEILLLGSAEGSIRLIHRIDDPELAAEWLAESPPEQGSRPTSFAGVEGAVRANLERMRELLARKGGGPHA
ncbi:FliO/MopB family protein [Symbiobacterium thermophilum]|uniref:Flagellar assembly protein n=1 Tax=Symbiobacterium thermophilum (strain DSM 24528 / JCM 14929 / IAM 14863 / T) TaxID=292459 RepID=Q67K25_SYMTH|nr:flagellar biosynthetic protein FliO [Symbiobacterium thermophilum]BAD41975.1 flagellar assembly protein [Symbiobacterium thermophilum IAM 14863]